MIIAGSAGSKPRSPPPGSCGGSCWRIKAGDHSTVEAQVGGDFSRVTVDHILSAAKTNDGVSVSVVRDTIRYVGLAVANLVTVLDPECIVLGGMLPTVGDTLLEPVRQECYRRLPSPHAERLRILTSTLGPRRRRHRRGTCRNPAASMILLAGAAVVLPDRVLPASSVLIDGDRIAAIEPRIIDTPHGATRLDLAGMHDRPGLRRRPRARRRRTRRARWSRRRRRGGVAPAAIRRDVVLPDVDCLRSLDADGDAARGLDARVLRRRLAPVSCRRISKAISSILDFKGAQPASCLRVAQRSGQTRAADAGSPGSRATRCSRVIERTARAVGIVTVAPELDGGIGPRPPAGERRPSGVDRPQRGDLRAGPRGHRRRRHACHAPLQPHVGDDASRARRAWAPSCSPTACVSSSFATAFTFIPR